MASQRVLLTTITVLLCLSFGYRAYADQFVYTDQTIVASESSRTQQSSPEENVYNSSSLTVRQTPGDPTRTLKSWIKFDLNDLDVDRIASAILTLTLAQDRGAESAYLSAVNDDCHDNINWVSGDITWDNAPGNDTNSIGDLNPDKTTLLGQIDLLSGSATGIAGDSYTMDVTDVLRADTDGIVQFVLHKSSAYTNFASHANTEESWRPVLNVKLYPNYTAVKPSPSVTEQDVYFRQGLSWTPGPYVDGLSPQHKLFFSADFDDVNDGVGGVTLDVNNYPVGSLDLGKTYYWRVDEANSVSGWDRGVVWRFTVEPEGYPLAGQHITATASSNTQDAVKTIDGSGLTKDGLHNTSAQNMWLSSSSNPGGTWIQYDFDQPCRLYQMKVWNYNGGGLVGTFHGFKKVTIEYSLDGMQWTSLDNVPTFSRATGSGTDSVNTVVDFNKVLIQHVKINALSNWYPGGLDKHYGLSEVQFLAIPLAPREMSPADGSTGVDPNVTLKWRSGREADTHEVYFGSDPNNLSQVATVEGVPYATYGISSQGLQFGQTYYWQVKEVNTLETPSTWASDILSFTTQSSVVVDDFESYTNDSPHYVFQTWQDGLGYEADDYFPQGYGGNGTGSVLGYDIWTGGYTTVMETSIVFNGSQSLPMYYNGAGSQTDRHFTPAQDWSQHGISTLVIHFYGQAGNTGQLYVEINNTKIPYTGDAADIATETWATWNIDLASSGVDQANVSSLSIGVDGSDASGLLYIDDIELK